MSPLSNKKAPISKKDQGTRAKSHIFFHPDYTVGLGVTPSQPRERLVDYTTGRELHPALKIIQLR